ncbi:hypothetical protein [Paenibacillus sp. MMO-58]|uniref:hypothetical protein n=1 Tax=Paenibacillus sp. MMO-58 TaxID=3081290 RepID=UPI00301B2C28
MKWLEWTGWSCNILGTIISFAGGILMWKGTPDDQLNFGTASYGEEIIYKIQGEEYLPAIQLRKRKRVSSLGIKMITIGFMFQFLGVCLQLPK